MKKYILKSAVVGIWYMTACIVIPLIIINLLTLIFPDSSFLSDNLGSFPKMQYVLGLLVGLNLLGITIKRYLRLSLDLNSIYWPQDKQVGTYLGIVTIFSYSFWKGSAFFQSMRMGGFIILLLFISFFIREILIFYTLFAANLLSKNSRSYFGESKYFIGSLVLIIGGIMVLIGTGYYTNKRIQREGVIAQNFIIKRISPDYVMHSERVMLHGYNFGWQDDKTKWKVKSSDGDLPTNYWTDTEISVTIPLQMKEGKRQIWVEHPRGNNPLYMMVSSNQVTITVVSRFTYMRDIDDSIRVRILKKVRLHLHYLNNYIHNWWGDMQL